MSQSYEKPLPSVNPLTAPFWEGARIGKLMLQKCLDCKKFQFYPRPYCKYCGSSNIAWTESTGRGTLYSFTIVRQVLDNVKAFERDLPFALALVQLEEGPRLLSNIADCRLQDIRIGLPLRVIFEKAGDEILLPKFTLAESSS